LEGRYIISEFDPAIGKPLGKHATKYKYHCGYLVRERIPITCREWKFKKSAPHISYVSDVDKRLIWDDIQLKFTFETEKYHDVITHEQLVAKVYDWSMKLMATQFVSWKKDLYNKYIKKNETPNWFVQAPIAKQRPYWEEFVQYKISDEAKERSRKNQLNASKKEYHHCMGSGGYASFIPKLQKLEAELLSRNITPETLNWPERTKQWLFGHGGRLCPETGKVIHGPKLEQATKRLINILEAKASGLFRPDREREMNYHMPLGPLSTLAEQEAKGPFRGSMVSQTI
jgi:hypothetical protein